MATTYRPLTTEERRADIARCATVLVNRGEHPNRATAMAEREHENVQALRKTLGWPPRRED